MQQPLALLFYEKLMPGGLLVNRLTDLKYRVQVVSELDYLADTAIREKPMIILADMECTTAGVGGVLALLKRTPATEHIPVIAFADEGVEALVVEARVARATLVVTDAAVVAHLPQLLEQALRLE